MLRLGQMCNAAGLFSLAAAGFIAALYHPAARAQVMLEPVGLELSQRQRIAVLQVSLTERAPAPVRLQAELLRWRMDAAGESITEPADELMITPPIVELKPGQRQVFRVAVRTIRPSQNEAAYRLILEDISPKPVDEAGKPLPGLSIRMRYDLPVMVAPTAPLMQSLRFKSCAARAGASEACLRVRNAGSRRLRVDSLLVAGEGWQHSLALGETGLLLAGGEREWRVPLQGADPGKLLEVRANLGRGKEVQILGEAP